MRVCAFFPFLLVCFLIACGSPSEPSEPSEPTFLTILGSDRHPLYRMEIASGWQIDLPSEEIDLRDSRQPLCTLRLTDSEGCVTMTIHHFPARTLEARIPTAAQIGRWQRQFGLDSEQSTVQTTSWGGYYGQSIEGCGILAGGSASLMAWSLQLCSEEFLRALSIDDQSAAQRAADVAIKVWGTPKLMRQRRAELIEMAESFALLTPFPEER